MAKRAGALISREDVLKAAVRCFRKFGINRTRMIDVADEASISRQSIYRLFATREELLEALAAERILVLAAKLQTAFAGYKSLDEALIEGSVASIKAGKSDKLLAEITSQSDSHAFDQFLFGGSPEVQKHMLDLWAPILDRARAKGELRKDISNERVVEWIRNVHALMSIRDDYNETVQRRVLADFLVPSVIKDSA